MPGSESPKPRGARAILAPTVLALSWALVSSTTACAGSAKDLALVRDELAKVQRDHDALAKRVFELEAREAVHQEETHAATGASASAAPGDGAEPASATAPGDADGPSGKPLKVVKLAPPTVMAAEPLSSAGSSTTGEDDDGPRPTLEIGPTGIKQSEPDAPSPAKGKKPATSKNPVLDPAAAKDYDAAFALVKAKKHAQALDAFAGFLVRYPDHPYAANALFWRGECYYAVADYTASIGQYEALLARFPASAKSADGLLKLGLAHKRLGADAKARDAFARLRKEFPTSEAAKKIPPEDAS